MSNFTNPFQKIKHANAAQPALPSSSNVRPAKVGKLPKSLRKLKGNRSSFEWMDLLKAMAVSMGAILIYGLFTNIALLNNGIYVPADPVAHNLAYIISCIVSGAIFAFASFNYVDTLSAFTSPVDAILSYFHYRHDTSLWHTLARVGGQIAGAFLMVATLYVIYEDKDRVKLAANVVNPLNISTNGNTFTAFALETIGTIVLALAVFTLDAQHRKASDRALIKGFLMAGLRLAVFQYTTASFNFFIAFAIDICSGQWNTFSGGSWYIFPLSMVVGLVVSGIIIMLQRWYAQTLADRRFKHYGKQVEQPREASHFDDQPSEATLAAAAGSL